MGYGRLGTKIVREIALTDEGDIEMNSDGAKTQTIFMICRINRFTEVVNALQEEITVYVNKLAKIIYECAERWDGDANKNNGEVLLITWKLPNIDDQESDSKKEDALKLRTKLAVKALTSAIKMIAEIDRASDLRAYSKHPRIRTKYTFIKTIVWEMIIQQKLLLLFTQDGLLKVLLEANNV